MCGKRKLRTPEEQELLERAKQISAELERMLPRVLERTKEILEYPIMSVQSLHGKIGGKNNDYINVADDHFPDYRKFQIEWANGLLSRCQKTGPDSAAWDIVQLYKDNLCREYILLFQERNFCKHYEERIRRKPSDQLWKVWFGSHIPMGLFIAPVQLPNGTWRIDHSEIRRAKYNYWTIGHILSVEGFINAENSKLYPISNLEQLITFYEHIVFSSSSSVYEKGIYKRYIRYLRDSANVEEEPFLIPEFHYEGELKKCRYRLDFTILNPHTFEYTGFELSPASTHMHVEKILGKTQTQINEELSKQWAGECIKRNEYFQKYGITCITFTDSDLQDLDKCFEVIASYLRKRPVATPSMEDVLAQMKAIM